MTRTRKLKPTNRPTDQSTYQQHGDCFIPIQTSFSRGIITQQKQKGNKLFAKSKTML